ncbi:excalibur calcium-binding domain-containing protein [Micrococcus yunnanensis]|uniref:excalibur calcium-binding domain-containing protein n=1 Tax=Micrococcus yunnanensis TaxID=566027 RepID=UPI0010723D73|nr:excalibur calcium-binding domain-containing protein [Micrococcus yunnanensis]MBF0744812.1 excalibur calcium-binding domain-containing protein [Micrococcus yunnanensis]TFU55153.1 excalibur calcium-binding domain-containing protein [Micrococcus yunnanensis]
MKKIVTGATLTAALGLSLFAAAPATALDRNGNFQNCDEVYASGLSHISPDHPQYDKGLDNSDDDVIGCENPESAGYYNTKRWAATTPMPEAESGLPDHVTQPDWIDEQYTYPDCKDAFAAGVYNIPSDSEYYHEDLDADLDGVGCEYNVEYGVIVEGREQAAAAEIEAIKTGAVAETEDESQVSVVPVGAAETGVAPAADPAAAFAVGALGLAGVAGAAVLVRRRAQA